MAANIAAQAALPVALAQAQQDFEACFLRLGLNQNQVNAYVQAIGVHTVADFRITQYGKSEEKTLIKDVKVPGDNTRFNNVQSVHIIAFRHWVNYMDSKGVAADPNLFAPTGVGNPMLNDWIDRRLIIHDIPTAPPTPLVIAPFLSTKDWREFYANVVTACGGQRNPKTGVLYLYLTREHTAVTPAMLAATYDSIDDELIATTLHQGVQFTNDNRELFLAISTAV
jgi:hypothetical protein